MLSTNSYLILSLPISYLLPSGRSPGSVLPLSGRQLPRGRGGRQLQLGGAHLRKRDREGSRATGGKATLRQVRPRTSSDATAHHGMLSLAFALLRRVSLLLLLLLFT